MLYLVTRNRLDQPPTIEMDEVVDGKLTGKIVTQSKIIDGKYIPIYKGEEPFEPNTQKFAQWFQKYFDQTKERKTFAESIGEPEGEKYEVHVIEFDWIYGHRKEDCKSKKHALERQKKWIETFSWAEFSNWKLYAEVRYRNETIID